MPRRLLLALIVLVAAPLALLGWISASAMRQQQDAAAAQLHGLLQRRLEEIDRNVSAVFDQYERELAKPMRESSQPIATLRRLQLNEPAVRQGIFVGKDGLLLYPPKPTADDPEMISLHAALSAMIGGRPDLTNQDDAVPPDKPTAGRQKGKQKLAVLEESRWQVWYMDEGAQLILWFARGDGSSAGVLMERARWMSDLTAILPDSRPAADSIRKRDAAIEPRPSGFTALVDESQNLIYRWGDDETIAGQPLASLSLSPPLSTWQLQFHTSGPLIPQTSLIPMVLSLSGLGIVLVALGAYVLTSVQRQMRTARNRVTFAGQVSHELRTPLTNIRLYAELAEADLQQIPAGEPRQSIEKRLAVIDSESRRLGRLVSGVLEMIRDDVKHRPPHLSLANPDELIGQTLQQFAPSFANAGIEVHCHAAANEWVKIDADIFEMVLVNLLSNVEKYAADGGRVDITSQLNDDLLLVTVADQGKGISARHRRSIFRAFSRVDDSINAPSGTGIGLTIALRAAQRHGGDLSLVPTQRGACFEFRIPVQR